MKRFLIYSLLVLNLCTTIAFWWHFSGSLYSDGTLVSTLLATGRLAGLLAMNLIFLQLILIGRVKWVETVFGLDKLSRLHRWNGHAILVLILLHPTLITLSHSLINQTTYFSQLADFLLHWKYVLLAFIGFLLLLTTIGLSITIVRKRLKYETWWYVHFLNYAAIALIFWHQLQFTPEAFSPAFRIYWWSLAIISVMNFVWFRLVMMVYKTYKHQFRVSRVEDLGIATSVYISGVKMDEYKVHPGQFAFYAFYQKGFQGEKHPFSFSMVPKNNEIRFTAKKLGDFTNKLPELKVGSKVMIDGPHGTFTESLIRREKLLFIAGGSGITPIRSLLESLGPKRKDMVLLYSNKTRADIMLGDELAELSKQHGFKIVNILADEQVAGFENGRLDGEMIKRLVPDVLEREAFLCGPPPMTQALRGALKDMGLASQFVHYEKFAL
jgi:predicted ferric reductase